MRPRRIRRLSNRDPPFALAFRRCGGILGFPASVLNTHALALWQRSSGCAEPFGCPAVSGNGELRTVKIGLPRIRAFADCRPREENEQARQAPRGWSGLGAPVRHERRSGLSQNRVARTRFSWAVKSSLELKHGFAGMSLVGIILPRLRCHCFQRKIPDVQGFPQVAQHLFNDGVAFYYQSAITEIHDISQHKTWAENRGVSVSKRADRPGGWALPERTRNRPSPVSRENPRPPQAESATTD